MNIVSDFDIRISGFRVSEHRINEGALVLNCHFGDRSLETRYQGVAMATGNRAKRVGDQILKIIAPFLLQKVKDPRVEGVTLTGVRLSKDLRIAKVYFSVLGEDRDIRNATDGLESAKGFIKRELGARLDLRVMPDIQFLHDETFARGLRIERLLDDLRRTSPHGDGSFGERSEIKGKESSDEID